MVLWSPWRISRSIGVCNIFPDMIFSTKMLFEPFGRSISMPRYILGTHLENGFPKSGKENWYMRGNNCEALRVGYHCLLLKEGCEALGKCTKKIWEFCFRVNFDFSISSSSISCLLLLLIWPNFLYVSMPLFLALHPCLPC